MRWFAIDIDIFGLLSAWVSLELLKNAVKVCGPARDHHHRGSKLRTDSQIDNFLIWFEGETEVDLRNDWLFSCCCSSFYGLIGFIGLAQCWGVFG